MSADAPDEETTPPKQGSPVRRAVLISLALVALLLGGLAVASWLSADPETLPFDYDGFN
jgi:hypothetical protein